MFTEGYDLLQGVQPVLLEPGGLMFPGKWMAARKPGAAHSGPGWIGAGDKFVRYLGGSKMGPGPFGAHNLGGDPSTPVIFEVGPSSNSWPLDKYVSCMQGAGAFQRFFCKEYPGCSRVATMFSTRVTWQLL